jgi:hypothetical protein
LALKEKGMLSASLFHAFDKMLEVWKNWRKPCATIFALQQRNTVSLLQGV